jgi:hypothetical protein
MNRLTRFAVVALRPRAFSSVVAAPRILSGVAKFQQPAVKIAFRAFGAHADDEVGSFRIIGVTVDDNISEIAFHGCESCDRACD